MIGKVHDGWEEIYNINSRLEWTAASPTGTVGGRTREDVRRVQVGSTAIHSSLISSLPPITSESPSKLMIFFPQLLMGV